MSQQSCCCLGSLRCKLRRASIYRQMQYWDFFEQRAAADEQCVEALLVWIAGNVVVDLNALWLALVVRFIYTQHRLMQEKSALGSFS